MLGIMAATSPSTQLQQRTADDVYQSLLHSVYDTSRHIPMGLFDTEAQRPLRPANAEDRSAMHADRQRWLHNGQTPREATAVVDGPHVPPTGNGGALAIRQNRYSRPPSSSLAAPSSVIPKSHTSSTSLTSKSWASIAFDEDFFRLAVVSEERVAFQKVEILVSLFLGKRVSSRSPRSPRSPMHPCRSPRTTRPAQKLLSSSPEAASVTPSSSHSGRPVQLKLLKFFDSPIPGDSPSGAVRDEDIEDDISWTPSRTLRPAAPHRPPTVGDTAIASFTLSDVVAEFPSDDVLHAALHDAEMRMALTKAMSWENRILCVEHEGMVRDQIAFEYNVQTPLIHALAEALHDMLQLWATAIRVGQLEHEGILLLQREASERHRIEGWCWSCALEEDDNAQTAHGVRVDPSPDACRRPALCGCMAIDIAVRRLSAIFLPPSPQSTCAFVNIVVNGRVALDAEYLDACRVLLTAEQDVVRLYAAHEEAVHSIAQEERANFSKIIAYLDFEAKRVEIEEEITAAAHKYAAAAAAPRSSMGTDSDGEAAGTIDPDLLQSMHELALRRIRPMTFALFARLLSLQYVETLQRASLVDATYWLMLQQGLAGLEAQCRVAVADHWTAGVAWLFEQFAIGDGNLGGPICALYVVEDAERTAWADLVLQHRSAVNDIQRRQAAIRRRNTRVLLENVTDFAFVEWERRRRDQIAFLESQIYLQLAALARNILREVVSESTDTITRTSSIRMFKEANDSVLAAIALTHSVQRLYRLEEAARANLAAVEDRAAVVLEVIIGTYHSVVSGIHVSLAHAEASDRACIGLWKSCIRSRNTIVLEEASASRLFHVQLLEPRRCGADSFFSKLLLSDLAETFCSEEELRLVWVGPSE